MDVCRGGEAELTRGEVEVAADDTVIKGPVTSAS